FPPDALVRGELEYEYSRFCHLPQARSVVVDNFHLCWPRLSPAKTETVLVINANTVLSLAIPFQGLQPVSWGNLEVREGGHRVQLIKFADGNLPQGLWAGASDCLCPHPVEDVLCTRALE